MSLNKSIEILLVSSQNFFREGIHRVLEDKCNLKIIAEASTFHEVEERLTSIKPEFLLLDNRYVQIDLNALLNLIIEQSPATKVICLAKRKKEKLHFPGVIYITKKTDSSKVRRIVEAAGLNKLASTKKKAHARDLGNNNWPAGY